MKTFQFPLIRITLVFVLGIVVERLMFLTHFQLIGCTLLSAALVIATYPLTLRQIQPNLFFGLLTAFAFFFLGMSTARTHAVVIQSHHYHSRVNTAQSMQVIFELDAPLRSGKKSYRYLGSLHSMNALAVTGKVVIAFPKNKKRPEFNRLYAGRVWFTPTAKAPNPGQFDYGAYLKNKSIYAQLWVNNYRSWPLQNTSISQRIVHFHSTVAQRLSASLSKETVSIIMALILGQQHDIPTEIAKEYQLAGAVHILSVSGLHVGFILLLVQFILQPLPNTKKYRLLKLFLILIALWGFGILAGLAPSVLRSVTMYSFVAIGKYLKRSINSYNTLCISAFLILCFNPNTLWDVGFQLSYIALFFIIWLQPILKKGYRPKTKIGTYFWDLTTVSFAAQLGTLPISLFYFHQFPGLFFLTNWIILPPLGLLMVLGLLAVIIASLDGNLGPIAFALSFAIEKMNGCIHWIAQQEQFILEKIPMNLELTLVLYLLIFTSVWFIQKCTFRNVLGLGIGLIALQITVIRITMHQNESAFVVCHVPKHSVLIWRHGKIWYSGKDSTTLPFVEDFQRISFVSSTAIQPLPSRVFCHNKRIAIVDNLGIFPRENDLVLVLRNNPKCHLESWLEKYPPKTVVADGSSTPAIKKLWKRSCEKLKIPFHDTAEKGPFIL